MEEEIRLARLAEIRAMEIEKSYELEEWLNSFTKVHFGRIRFEAADTQTCVCCGGEANSFRDEVSRKEYSISRMCQKCQDEIW
jgi:hypothetical protein